MAQYKTLNNFANEFNSSTSYAVGDLVMYLGELYVCSTTHNASSWNSSHFTKTSVATQLANAGGGELGVIELTQNQSVLTASQIVEFNKKYCIIKDYNRQYYYKDYDHVSNNDTTTYFFPLGYTNGQRSDLVIDNSDYSINSLNTEYNTPLYVHKIVINGALDADDNPCDIGFYVVSLRDTTIQLPSELSIDEWERFCKEVALLFSTAHNTLFFEIYNSANHTSQSKLDTYLYYDFTGIHFVIKDYQGGDMNYLAGPQDATFTEQILTLSQYVNELSALLLDLQ